MDYKIYFNKKKPVFLYIHGECLSYASFKAQVSELKKDYTLILAEIDGHGNQAHIPFTSIHEIACSIVKHIQNNYQGHIQVLSGFSLGGQIITEILSIQPDICDFAIIESAAMRPFKIQNWSHLIAQHITPLTKNKFINSFMYYTNFNDDYALDDYYHNFKHMTNENIQSVLKASHSYQLPALKNISCKMAIIVGQREPKIYKQSANLLHKAIPNSEIFMPMNYTHGDFSLGYPQEYIRFIKIWIQKKDRHLRIAQEKKEKDKNEVYLPNWKHVLNKIKEKKGIQ